MFYHFSIIKKHLLKYISMNVSCNFDLKWKRSVNYLFSENKTCLCSHTFFKIIS